MPRVKNNKTNLKNIEISSSNDLFEGNKPKKQERKSKKNTTKNTPLINEVLEKLCVTIEYNVNKDTTIDDLPSPNIQNAADKFGFAISTNDKIIDIANKIQRWYN